jgi:hypothetical protein
MELNDKLKVREIKIGLGKTTAILISNLFFYYCLKVKMTFLIF